MTELRNQLFSTMETPSLSSIARDVVSPRVTNAARKMQDLIERVTYKPGYKFEVVPPSPYSDYAHLRVVTPPVQNTYKPNDPTQVGPLQFLIPVPWFFDDMSVRTQIHWFRDHVIYHIEQHEADEWFRVDNIMCFNPHGENRFPPDA